jgi:hypothetical protein
MEHHQTKENWKNNAMSNYKISFSLYGGGFFACKRKKKKKKSFKKKKHIF